jgi:hypothetical protein
LLHLTVLCKHYTTSSLQSAPTVLLPTLHAIYSRVFDHINAEDEARVKRLLHRLCFVAHPFIADELAEIFQVGCSVKPPISESGQLKPYFCGSFLIFLDDSDAVLRRRVQLSRSSIRDYLLSQASRWKFSVLEANVTTMRSGIAYFLSLNPQLTKQYASSVDQIHRTGFGSLAHYFLTYLPHYIDLLSTPRA